MIALSYSRLNVYEQCAFKFNSQYILKNYPDDSDNPAFVRGSAIHPQCEKYINFKTGLSTQEPSLRSEAQNAVPIIDKIIGSYDLVLAEQKLAMDIKYSPASWFHKTVAYRAVLDMVAIKDTSAVIIDFKTGKVRNYDDKDTGQLRLAAFFIFSTYPQVNDLSTTYLFLDHKQSITRKFTRKDKPGMEKTFTDLYNTVNNDKDFVPTKNQFCNWCDAPNCPYK